MRADCSSRSTCLAASPSSIEPLIWPSRGIPITETIPRIVVDGRIEGSTVRVTVDDNGPGIPAADRERVFRPFVTTKGRGTGLGLALVQKIIVTHNGRIQLAANPHGGASVQIVLPLPPA